MFTDGCRGQYKGKRNFNRIAQFPSNHPVTWVPGPIVRGVNIIHRFAASHHFKGTHDACAAPCVKVANLEPMPGLYSALAPLKAWCCSESIQHVPGAIRIMSLVRYGKDAKHLARTAERNQRVRLATTHDLYYFCHTTLPAPRKGMTAERLLVSRP